jgi:integrase
MLALGTRNGEACGLNYGDIKTLQQFSEDVVAWIYKSTIPDSSTLQSSGKTWNTGRIVPVPQKVARYLEERKQRLERHLEEIGELGKVCIEDLPIVCKGNMLEGKNYEQRASARAVSNAAKEIFKFIEVEGRQLAYIEAELLEDSYGETVNEKDPTAYLLRRNYATHLQLLGLSVSEIQYLIGHNVEDIYESRNEFVDEKRIHEMAKKLSYRPLLNELKKDTDILEVTLKKGEEARIIIEAQEPLDKLEITVIGCGKNKACTGRYFTESYEKKYDRVIDVTQAYHKAYY